MIISKTIFITVTLVFTFCIIVFPQPVSAGLESIKREDLLNTVEILASKEFDGRLSGSEGYNNAANFSANKFAELGLKPAGEDNYFQYLNVEYNKIDTPAVVNFLSEEKHTYVIGKDFVFRGFTGSADFTLPVAFCGYGISRPDLGFDEYENINVTDKIVIVFKQNPKWKMNDENWINGSPREKSRVAFEHGAKGIFFVTVPNDNRSRVLFGSVAHGEGEQLEDFPQLHISSKAANDFIGSTGYTIEICQERIEKTQEPFSFVTLNKAEIKVNANYEKNAKTMNIIGMIEGSDPQLKHEYLIIGAHLDHVGSQAGLLFPGANDNASGSAGLLEIAEAFQLSNLKPKRSILFVLFASEEQGLFGSEHFVKNLNVKPENVTAMFNLDCVGYGDSIQIGNGKSAPELWNIVNKIDEENSGLMVSKTWSGGGADATPFHEVGIPCLYFVSKFSYDHLHQPTDTPKTLNPNLYESLVRLAFLAAREVTDGNYRRENIIN
ncbi:MAG: M20/M25/M40 family metallo-hydrolase [Ignavibacteria bacterium]|nr:M20/M25/M40 family metallo-hydrolase [Ignavibacteria bacterium]MBT8381490.1 M20/M25/M40 family metallo-hydrolase [Ignavibacteria bacterium]MBT8391552.1 M20/M25/M40 family metallo-hydrolase [Ignavibacteria bacterium]NNJ52244.1 M20/M25/M40 family metallo-hydrolase [Ignavibacteriaceae bacterium]NNL22721.1 M20/M25/M40 family metallo-hydrolase [Ignavibacteriaceae bacterium]